MSVQRNCFGPPGALFVERSACALRAAAVLTVLAACGHALPPPRPLPPPEDRERMELAACQDGKLPPWLDDQALDEATRLDRYSNGSFEPNDSYQPGTPGTHAAPLPPPRPTDRAATSRAASIMGDRQDFKKWCDGLRVGQRLKLPAK